MTVRGTGSALANEAGERSGAMAGRGCRRFVVWALCCTVLALTAPHLTAQKEFSSANRKRGQAVVEYRDKAAHIVAAYNYSQRNHDSRWIVIQAALSMHTETTIHPGD